MAGALAGLATGARPASAAFPDRQVKLVVPFPAGGSYDVIGRVLAERLSAKWGQTVIIENRPGASGNLGSQLVAQAAPDGLTLLLFGDGLLINQSLFERVPFDVLRDFAGITLIATSPQVFVVHKDAPYKTPLDFVGASGDLIYATAGPGTPGQLAGELFKRKTGAKLRHVPYRGGAPALNDLLGRQVQAVYTGLPACLGLLKSGEIRALAVSSAARTPAAPDVPSFSEFIPGYDVDTWYGLLAPKRTPTAIVKQIAEDMRELLKDEALRRRLLEQGFETKGSTPEELDAKLKDDLPRWRDLVVEAGAKATE
jgi:tripartite-type tricarboxylate transporter receptor subunit TctC